MQGEIRYASLKRTFPEEAEKLHTMLVEQFNKRYEELALMADPTLVCQSEAPVAADVARELLGEERQPLVQLGDLSYNFV